MSVFPGGTALTLLDVYEDEAVDGLRGGSPHVHLVSTEAYVVLAGEGRLHTVDGTGFQETRLRPGVVEWFTPGTLHRAVNDGGLRVLVVMSNAGLPEAGDAVLAFPDAVLADEAGYRSAARVAGNTEGERAASAARRRDLAVEGFLPIAQAAREGDLSLLHAFHARASALAAPHAARFTEIVTAGPLARAEASVAAIEALAAGSDLALAEARVRTADVSDDRAFGMCGRIRPYDLDGR